MFTGRHVSEACPGGGKGGAVTAELSGFVQALDEEIRAAWGQAPRVLGLCRTVGALDVQATRITEEMLLAASRALADLAREEVTDEVERACGHEHFTFGPDYILPKPLDPRILVAESAAVAACAVKQGVALAPVEPAAYKESLIVRLGTGRETLRGIILKARRDKLRVVFPEGTSETVLRACGILGDEGIASPILLGDEDEIREVERRLGMEAGGAVVIDPERSPRLKAYTEEYFRLRGRHGVMREGAEARVRRPEGFAAMMLHSGDADLLIGGATAHYAESLRALLPVIGTAPGVRRISSLYIALVEKEVFFLADCAVNIDPDAEDMAETALLASALVHSLGLEPRVAMLSFSNFGSVEHPHAAKARRAAEIAAARAPDLAVDGEMQLHVALDSEMRAAHFPF